MFKIVVCMINKIIESDLKDPFVKKNDSQVDKWLANWSYIPSTICDLVETLIKLKKSNPEMAKELAKKLKKQKEINLDEISRINENIAIAGKVLSYGEINKKIKIVAWNASKRAIEKIKKAGSEFSYLTDEIKKNPELKNLRIIK